MEVHRVTLGDFNPWFERRLARKYTPCLAGVVEALTPVLSCFATIRAQAEELGVAMLKEERSPTGVSASDASLPVVRQHVDNSIHLVDRIANTFPECPLDYEFLSGFVKHGRDCLKQLSLNSVALQQLADAPYNEVHRASKAAHTPSPTPPATTAGRAFPPPPSRVPAPCPCAAEHGEPQGAQGPDGAQALDDPLGPRAAAARPRRPRGAAPHLQPWRSAPQSCASHNPALSPSPSPSPSPGPSLAQAEISTSSGEALTRHVGRLKQRFAERALALLLTWGELQTTEHQAPCYTALQHYPATPPCNTALQHRMAPCNICCAAAPHERTCPHRTAIAWRTTPGAGRAAAADTRAARRGAGAECRGAPAASRCSSP